jgi:NADH dehydrogenase
VHERGGSIGQGVELVEGDLTIPATFHVTLRRCDAAVNLVGIIREFPSRGVTFEELHVRATKNLVDAAVKGGIRRIIHMSAQGTRPDAASLYHRTKFYAEECVRASGLDWTIFRPSIIFGPGDDFVNRVAGLIRSLPAVPVIGDGAYQLQPISADDVARCFAMALEMPETTGKAYELCGPDRFTYNELLDAIGRAIGRPTLRKLRIPLPLMKAIVPIFQRIPSFPITMDQILMLLEGNICDGKWRETFGFRPERFVDGIARFLKP